MIRCIVDDSLAGDDIITWIISADEKQDIEPLILGAISPKCVLLMNMFLYLLRLFWIEISSKYFYLIFAC